jgi:hypothetical protein
VDGPGSAPALVGVGDALVSTGLISVQEGPRENDSTAGSGTEKRRGHGDRPYAAGAAGSGKFARGPDQPPPGTGPTQSPRRAPGGTLIPRAQCGRAHLRAAGCLDLIPAPPVGRSADEDRVLCDSRTPGSSRSRPVATVTAPTLKRSPSHVHRPRPRVRRGPGGRGRGWLVPVDPCVVDQILGAKVTLVGARAPRASRRDAWIVWTSRSAPPAPGRPSRSPAVSWDGSARSSPRRQARVELLDDSGRSSRR